MAGRILPDILRYTPVLADSKFFQSLIQAHHLPHSNNGRKVFGPKLSKFFMIDLHSPKP